MSISLFSRSGSKSDRARKPDNFVHSVLSYTKLEVPTVEVFETAVTFAPDTSPLSAHAELAGAFGQRAGEGHFLFRADSTIGGRYWVQSVKPWPQRPARAVSALEPKRTLIQVAPGLMYRFTLLVCAGRARLEGAEKEVEPFRTKEEVEHWFKGTAERYGMRLLMADVTMTALRFEHRGSRIRIDHAAIEGALEVLQPDFFRARILRGFGHHRRAGLGMIQLSA